LRQLGDHHPALARANHAASVDDDTKHDGDDAGHANDAAVNDDVAELDKHHPVAGRWLSNNHNFDQHDHDTGQLPHASRGW